MNPAGRRLGQVSGRDPSSLNGRWRAYDYDELIARDKASLDIGWLKDDSLADKARTPPIWGSSCATIAIAGNIDRLYSEFPDVIMDEFDFEPTGG